MTMDEACRIVGYNAPRYAIRNMTEALQMFRDYSHVVNNDQSIKDASVA